MANTWVTNRQYLQSVYPNMVTRKPSCSKTEIPWLMTWLQHLKTPSSNFCCKIFWGVMQHNIGNLQLKEKLVLSNVLAFFVRLKLFQNNTYLEG